MRRLCPPIAKSPRLQKGSPHKGTARRSAERPDGGIGRRAGLKHQWSNPCRFDPGSGYDKTLQVIDFQCSQGFSFTKTSKWSLLVTAMQKVTSKHLKISCSSSPWRIVMLYFSVGLHNFIPKNRNLSRCLVIL